MTKTPNSLNLVSDGDEIYFIEDIESSFGISFKNEELENIGTIGELYDLLLSKMMGVSHERKACHSATVFRKLRSFISEGSSGHRISPKTELKSLINSKYGIRPFTDEFIKITGLFVSLYTSGFIVIWFFILLFGAPILSIVYDSGLIWLFGWLLFFPSAYIIDRALPASYPSKTVGELATKISHLNFGKLAQETGTCHPDDIWKTLVVIANENRGTAEEITINRETRFY